jgi:hypothetical protein
MNPVHTLMAEVVSCWPVTAEASVQSQASPCGFHSEQSGTETGFSMRTLVFPCQYHSANVPYSFIHLSVMIYIVLAGKALLNSILKNSTPLYSVYLVYGLMRIPFNLDMMQHHTPQEQNPEPRHCKTLITCIYSNVIWITTAEKLSSTTSYQPIRLQLSGNDPHHVSVSAFHLFKYSILSILLAYKLLLPRTWPY